MTKGQYAASCFAVILATMIYRGLCKMEVVLTRQAVQTQVKEISHSTNSE
jgi:hypothetical protein